MIWSGVVLAAVASGRVAASPLVVVAGRAVFVIGLSAALIGFVYLRRRRLSVLNGSATHLALPPTTEIVPTRKVQV